MSSMNQGIVVGVIIGMLVVLVCWFQKRVSGKPENYDERQQIIRGRGYSYGFATLVAELMIYGLCITEDTVSKIIDPAVVMMGMIFVSGIVVVAYNVMHDAYFGFRKAGARMTYIWLALALSQLAIVASIISEGNYLENGRIGLGIGLASETSAFFLICFLIVSLKRILDRRESAE